MLAMPHPFLVTQSKPQPTPRTSRTRELPSYHCASCGRTSLEAELLHTYGDGHSEYDVSFCRECLDQGRPEDEADHFDCGGEGG